jgi:alpha-1,3-rhamnosyl/mannosyltransferase
MPVLGRMTGIGQYAFRLLEGLSDHPDVEAVDVFDGSDIIALPAFLSRVRNGGPADRTEKWKRLVRTRVPYAREMAARWRARRFRQGSHRQAWSVYHEPNYVSQRFPGAVVTTVCDMSFVRYPQFLPRDRLDWLRRRFHDSIMRSDAVIAISRFTRDEILELCPRVDPQRIVVTPLGVDADYVPADREHDSADAQIRHWGLPARFILCLGTLEPRKNLQGLLTAFRRLPADVQQAYPLVLAGTAGWREHYFRPMIDQLRREGLLYELGYVRRELVPALMRAASVFCFPSFYEGFGLPPLEAAACGTPVVCSRAASMPEVMGDAAVYLDPASPEELSAALLRVLEDQALREELGTAGPRRAAEFTWRKCVHATVAAYRAAA